MPFRFSRRPRYRPKRRTPFGNRRPVLTRGMRNMRLIARPTYNYKQTVLNPLGIGSIVVPPAVTFLQSYAFDLAQVGPNLGAFTSLYDQYRINKVVMKFVPKFNVSDIDAAGTTGGNLAMVATCLDYDDDSIPGAFSDVLERQNAKLHRSGIITRTLKPCVNFNVSTGITAGNSSRQSPWLDTQATAVPHFGVKIGITGVQVQQNYDIIVKYYLSFRQVR